HNTAIETPRAQQRRIENVRPVRGGYEDDTFIRLESIHLNQQLIEGLLALVVSAAKSRPAVASDGINFVDEDDAGRMLLTLIEQIADAARTHADEHFNEVRAADGEERHVGFTGNSAGKKSLAGSRGADQKNALGDASTQLLELLRIAQKFDDLLQLFLGL